MRNLIYFFVLSLLSTAAHAESTIFKDWTTEQKVQFTSLTLASAIDFSQTTWMTKQKVGSEYAYNELNPLLGKRPTDFQVGIAQIAFIGFNYYLISKEKDMLPFARKISENARWLMTGYKFSVVIYNQQNGITFSKVF